MRTPDPRVDVFTRRGQVFVSVRAPRPGTLPVDLAEARAALDAWPLATRDTRALAGAVRAAEGHPVACGTLQPAREPADEAPYAIVLSPVAARPFVVPWAGVEAPAPDRAAIGKALLLAGLPSTLAPEAGAPEGACRSPVPLGPEPSPRGHPGAFDLSWRDGAVLLTVTAPEDGGPAVRRDDVAGVLEEVPGVVIDEEALARALASPPAAPLPVARVAASARPEPGDVAVCTSDDGLAAYLVPWSHDPAQALAPGRAERVLAAAGITHGVLPNVVARLAREPFDAPRLVARGTPPVHGRDAAIQWLDPVHAGMAAAHVPHVLADGRVDYHDLGGETTVTADAVLAVKVEPVPAGPAGRSVLGRELPARAPRDVPLARHAGPGTRVAADGATLRAATAGLLVWAGDRFSVTTVRTIAGDVDFRTGHVVFDGSVVVRGNVKGGFRVKATGTIQVGGDASDAALEADGDIEVKGGVVGQEGLVRTGGALRAGNLHSVDVEAQGPVTVRSEVWQCRVSSGDVVRVSGRIVGGEVVGARAVVAQTLGTAVGTATVVQAGGDAPPTGEARARPGFRPSVVVATKAVFPGVTVILDGRRRDLERPYPPVTFRLQDGEVQALAGARLP